MRLPILTSIFTYIKYKELNLLVCACNVNIYECGYPQSGSYTFIPLIETQNETSYPGVLFSKHFTFLSMLSFKYQSKQKIKFLID